MLISSEVFALPADTFLSAFLGHTWPWYVVTFLWPLATVVVAVIGVRTGRKTSLETLERQLKAAQAERERSQFGVYVSSLAVVAARQRWLPEDRWVDEYAEVDAAIVRILTQPVSQPTAAAEWLAVQTDELMKVRGDSRGFATQLGAVEAWVHDIRAFCDLMIAQASEEAITAFVRERQAARPLSGESSSRPRREM